MEAEVLDWENEGWRSVAVEHPSSWIEPDTALITPPADKLNLGQNYAVNTQWMNRSH